MPPDAAMQDRTRRLLRTVKAASPIRAGAGGAGRVGGFSAINPPAISAGPSPLVASYDEWTSGRANGTRYSLPRDHESFLSGMFGPLAPIQTVPVDTPEGDQERPEPRRFAYPVGWNMPMGMPGTEGLGKLASFDTLRTLADLYSVARACIELRKSELRGIGWDIVLTKNAAKALRGSSSGMKEFEKRRSEAVKFFRRPDPDYADFSTWFDALLEEVFVTDSLSLYIQPAMGKRKGLLGSDLAALDLLDGSLIRPLVDIRGGRPVPPNPGYQQFLYGVPRVDLMTLLLGRDDLDEKGMVAEYRGDQLMYLPYTQRTWTPYGMAPIERAIIPVLTGLNKQQFQMNFFTEGSIPGLFISPGDPNLTPTQIRDLQDALNALAGDQAWKHKIIVLPGGSKVDPQKPVPLADQFDEIIMAEVCMAFSVMPMELGISPQISSSQTVGAANQMAKSSQDIQERKGTVPMLLWLKSAVFDRILQDVCGQEDLEWSWEGLEEDEDAETLTNLLVQQVSAGMRSIDEARQELGLDPWSLPVTSDPGWATDRYGYVPFTAHGTLEFPAGPGQLSQPIAMMPGAEGDPGRPTRQTAGSPATTGAPPPALHVPATLPSQGDARTSNGRGGTPAHAAAASNSGGKKKPAAKVQLRELDLLRAYLRKGGDIVGWRPRHIPGAMLASIAEDLTKGLSADWAVSEARKSLDWQDRGEPERHRLGIDGTAGDAQDVPHPYAGPGWCTACGLAATASVHDQTGTLAAAGLVVLAADTGRVLMLQRAMDEDDDAAGTWEFPGGRIEDGEDAWAAACREWAEETGCQLPAGTPAGSWDASNGVYRGHILIVPAEADVPILGDRDAASNPDDPDGDLVEALAWWDPAALIGCPVIRPELAADARHVQAAVGVAAAGAGPENKSARPPGGGAGPKVQSGNMTSS